MITPADDPVLTSLQIRDFAIIDAIEIECLQHQIAAALVLAEEDHWVAPP